MTPEEIDIAHALVRCTFQPGSTHKRFARAMVKHAKRRPDWPLTPKQHDHLLRLAHRYRRQMPTWARLIDFPERHDARAA